MENSRPFHFLRPFALHLAALIVAVPQVIAAPAAAPLDRALHFEPNHGQFASQVRFVSRGAGYDLFLTDDRMVLRPDDARLSPVSIAWEDARAPRGICGTALQGAVSNHLSGSDPRRWVTGVPTYGGVRYERVYDGIDLHFYGAGRRVEYDFVVAAGASPEDVTLRVDGAQTLSIDTNGDLLIDAGGDAELRQLKPVAYQEHARGRVPVAARYVLLDDERIRFELGAYDRTRPLVIDPIISYSTFHGGDDYDWANAIAVDDAGNAYITGFAASGDFPTTEGAYLREDDELGYSQAFVAKFNTRGELVWSTRLGSRGPDQGFGIAVDAAHNVYVTGEFSSVDPPLMAGAFQSPASGDDAYVFKLNATGSAVLLGARVGGTFDDRARGIALHSDGTIAVAGVTYASLDFPTLNADQPVYGGGYTDGFLFKLAPDGSLLYSTYVGGGSVVQNNNRRVDECLAVAVDPAGNAYVTGMTNADDFQVTPGAVTQQYGSYDVFVRKYSPEGVLRYSARVGGLEQDVARGIDVDAAGAAYVTGETENEFPTTEGAFRRTGTFDAFVFKLSADASALVYSTLLGGEAGTGIDNGMDAGNAIAVAADGSAYVTGYTRSPNFSTVRAFQGTSGGGPSGRDAFVAKLDPNGQPEYSSYLGANGDDRGLGIALDGRGNAFVTGGTSSTLFPTTSGAAQRRNGSDDGAGGAHDDAFVTKIFDGSAAPQITGIDFIPPQDSTTSEKGRQATFGFVLKTQPRAAVTISVRSSNRMEGIVTSASSATFDAENWSTPQMFTITGVNDSKVDGDVSYMIITGVTSEDPAYSNLHIDDVPLTNIDDDMNGVAGMGFYFVKPCRAVDTRNTAPLAPGETRVLAVAGLCDVPLTARLAFTNLTAVAPAAAGHLSVVAGTQSPGATSTLNFSPGRTRANNALIALSNDGLGTVKVTNQSSGATHVLIDVSGYVQ